MNLTETQKERDLKELRDSLLRWAKKDKNKSMRPLWAEAAKDFEIDRLKIMRGRTQGAKT